MWRPRLLTTRCLRRCRRWLWPLWCVLWDWEVVSQLPPLGPRPWTYPCNTYRKASTRQQLPTNCRVGWTVELAWTTLLCSNLTWETNYLLATVREGRCGVLKDVNVGLLLGAAAVALPSSVVTEKSVNNGLLLRRLSSTYEVNAAVLAIAARNQMKLTSLPTEERPL